MHVAKLFREYGSNVWFEREAKDLLPEGYTNLLSPNGKFTKEEDIMDVWFDSGSSHTGVLVERGLGYPASMYLEGSDQYRGWFNSSLICGVAVHGCAPYKELVSHGFVLDGKGLKMSKSLGNAVDPLKVVREQGADVLRLWAASVDFTEDVRISDDLIKQVKESYRKIRNTYRFMLGNISDFDLKERVKYEDMPVYDKYMMNELSKFIKNVINAYESYNFQEVYKLVNNYVSFTLSNFYLDFTKDILYIEKKDSKVRRSVQTVLFDVLNTLVKLLNPILPYTSEEVYMLLPHDKESIQLELLPEVVEYSDSQLVNEMFEKFFKIKDDVYRALEDARSEKLIGKSLEAEVSITLDDKDFIDYFKDTLKQLLIVSKLNLNEGEYNITVKPFNGVKCERCWNLFDEDEMVSDVCKRCHEVIKEN